MNHLKFRWFCSTILMAFLVIEAWAIDTVPLPEAAENASLDKSLMRVTERAGRKEIRIPMEALQGKSAEGVNATIRQAYQILARTLQTGREVDKNKQGMDVPNLKIPTWARDGAQPQMNQRTMGALSGTAQIMSNHCPDLVIGVIPSATAAREYRWDPVNNGSGSIAYWPTFLPPQLPNSTYRGDWAGATGANFWGWIRVPGSWWWFDPIGSIASAEVFQYQLPSLSCNSFVAWYASAVADAPTPWYINADWAMIDTDWMSFVSPQGAGFPTSVNSYQFIAQGLRQSTGGTTVKYHEYDFEGEFNVPANIAPNIYLGLSLMLMAQDGEASTIRIGGLGDIFEFPNGIFYLQAPN